MFDNLLYQDAAAALKADIARGTFPGAVLFSGPPASGKLTCALETARALSCRNDGAWNCACPSCARHRALSDGGLLLCGPRDCSTEIAAAADTFARAREEDAPYLTAARYLFLRSVRKLLLRFSPVLWEGDDKLNKIAAVVSQINEELEELDFPHALPPADGVKKSCGSLKKLCGKLESDFLYDSVPVSQIRNASAWARLKSAEGKKTIIIENADRMLESVRNALLKILEEPPADTVFILTTARRSAVMPTILSRVRTYGFSVRTGAQQAEVIDRVFHAARFSGTIDEYLLTFLPVPQETLRNTARAFFGEIAAGRIPDAAAAVKECGGFEMRVMLRIFLSGVAEAQKKLAAFPAGAEASALVTEALRVCWNDTAVYNQSVTAALENLIRSLSKINKIYGAVFQCALP